MKELHKGLVDIKNIDNFSSKNEGSGSICKLEFKLPSFNDRDFIVVYSIKKFNNLVGLIGKNCADPKEEKSEGNIRGKMHFSIIIESKTDNLSKITYFSYVDLCGSVNYKMYNQALKKRKLHFVQKLNEIILKNKSENIKRPVENFKILDSYDEILMLESKSIQ